MGRSAHLALRSLNGVTAPRRRGKFPLMPVPDQETALERAEELAERVLPDRSPKRRMLVIVNPYATTVSDRLKNLVVYALQGRYSVEAGEAGARAHPTPLRPQAPPRGEHV